MILAMINKLKISLISKLLMLTVLMLPLSKSYGQEATEKKDPEISINYYNLINNSIFIKIDAKYKEDKTFVPINNLEIKLYLNEAKEENLIGNGTTNANGLLRVVLPEKFKAYLDSASSFNLLASSEATSILNEGEGTTTIENVTIELETVMEDSTRMLRAHVFKKEGNDKKPLAKVELNFFATRTFGMLPLSTDNLETDEDGMAELAYAGDIPGDSSGNMMVSAKLADADTYGNVLAFQNTNWGKKTKIDNGFSKLTALWASRANVPLWLLIISNSIIGAVWGTIIYLVFQLFRIRKLGKA